MSVKKRTFSKAQKLAIIKEASEQGVQVTLEKHSIYPATYYSWKKKLEEMGDSGFEHGMTKEKLRRLKQLEKENFLLKQLLAEKELEGRLKDDLLKKKYAWARKNP